MSISEKLTRLQNAKEDIKDAIVDNGGTVEQDDGLEEYPERITNRFGEVNNVLNILLKGPTLIEKTIVANGEYIAEDDNADGYSSVLVNVPSYSVLDAGKVVNNTGTALVSQTAHATITDNGTYDTTTNNSVVVDVGSDYDVTSVTGDDTYYGVPQLFMQNTQNYTILYGIMYPKNSETIITIPNDFNMKFTTYECSAANNSSQSGSRIYAQVNNNHTIRIYNINSALVGRGTSKPVSLIVLWK